MLSDSEPHYLMQKMFLVLPENTHIIIAWLLILAE